MSSGPHYGSMAIFTRAEDLLRAVRHLRAAGFTSLDAYAPHAVAGLAEALGMRASVTPKAMFAAGSVGGLGMLALQYYAAVVAYPVRVGGRPLASWPAFVPAALEVGLLCAVVAGVMLLFARTGLPRLYHPAFHVDAFARISQDRYALLLRSDDARYTPHALAECLAGYAPERVVEVPR